MSNLENEMNQEMESRQEAGQEPQSPKPNDIPGFGESFVQEGGNTDGDENVGEEKPETPKKVARGRKKAQEESAEEPIPPNADDSFQDEQGGDGFDESEEQDGSDTAVYDSEAESARVRRPRNSRVGEILDGEGRVIYDRRADDGQQELSVLSAARNSRRILSATLDGFEADEGIMPRAVFYLGSVKVLIPFSEMGLDMGADNLDRIEARMRINAMLGSKIYYMVRGVDIENRVAGASRRDAMLMRRRTILDARGSNNDYRIHEGVRCMAQVLYVDRRVARIEIYGMETYLHVGDISNLWVNDIREVIKVGDECPVEITEIKRDPESGRAVSIRASMRLAEETPQTELQVRNTYTGNISGFSPTAFYVKVAGVPQEVRCPIKSNHVGELMESGDFVKFYVRAIYNGAPTGAITKILKKARDNNRY